MEQFIDRQQAGQLLAEQLKKYQDEPNLMALALPRGGVPVAFEVAHSLAIPLEVFIVRKLGVPRHKEYAMGAMATGEIILLNQKVIDSLHIAQSEVAEIIAEEKKELIRREALYRVPNHHFLAVKDKTILLIDDGIATGSTMQAAILALRQNKPAKIIIAVPVGALSSINELSKLADEVVCLLSPRDFDAVGFYYTDFSQTSDEEVCELLKKQQEEWLKMKDNHELI